MEFELIRKYKKETYTIGDLYCNGVFVCNTLEDKDRGLNEKSKLSDIKWTKLQHLKETAIPKGRYLISTSYFRGMARKHKWYQTTSCKGHIPCLTHVPGFTGILIHCGVNAEHTEGCILVGRNTKKGRLTDSKICFKKISDLIMRAKSRDEEVWITIK